MSKSIYLSLMLLAASVCVSAQTYTVLHNFGSQPGDPGGPRIPGTIVQGRGGAMLTTASSKAFRISTDGSLQILHKFTDGWPYSGLNLASDGLFYGTTRGGGTFGFGSVFMMSPQGDVATFYDFTGGSDGKYPEAAPTESVEHDLYGTTTGNVTYGTAPYGSIYKITNDANFSVLHTFSGSDGAYPVGPLIQGTDFRFYGTTVGGGTHGDGTIFRISRSGVFEVLVNFDGTNGKAPWTGLIQANDGNFYGVTLIGGGSSNAGVLFCMTPGGAFTVLHSFTGGSDGSQPTTLLQASDDNLYGTNEYGGNGSGVIFRATLSGDVVPLHNFDFSTGDFPTALLQHTNGMLYGDTYQGGASGRGVFYSLDAGLPPFVTYLPVYGRVGEVVQILGQGFSNSSQVLFNGIPSSGVRAVYPTFIKVAVPSGATSGPITVTTSSGTLTSNKVFIVHPN